MDRNRMHTSTLAFFLMLFFLLPFTAQAAESEQVTFTAAGEQETITITETSGEMPTVNAEEFVSPERAARQLRDQMIERKEICTVYVRCDSANYQEVGSQILDQAFVHDGTPKGGDYLAMHWVGGGAQVYEDRDNSDFLYIFEFAFEYTSNATQEAVLDSVLSSQLNSMDLVNKSEYEKVSAVYHYILNNVTYDEAHAGDDTYLLKHTAYAAFVDKTAVVDGISTLLYRMLLELGIDNRIILGETSAGIHCWNIVKLDSVYYNTDITLDLLQTDYSFFLRNNENFPDHYRYAEYQTYEFLMEYPISGTDYVPGVVGEPEYVYIGGICGDDAYWCIDRDRNLTIFGTGATYDYRTDDAYGEVSPWIPWMEGVRQVVVEEGITYLGECLFYSQQSVKKATLPDSLEMIGGSAFGRCLGLAELDLGDGVKVIGASAFASCGRLTSLYIPDSVTHVQTGAFSTCGGLTSIRWSESMDTISENAFSGCTGLTSLDIPSNITRIEKGAFSACNGLTAVTIPSTVTYLSGFNNCTNLQTVTLLNSHIGPEAFVECLRLDHLVIPDTVTSIGEYAFRECSSLRDITWGSALVEIGDGAFANCRGSSELVLPEGLQKIGDSAFANWDLLREVTIPGTVTHLGGFSNCDNLTTLNTQNNFTHLGRAAFEDCNSLEMFPLPDTLIEIGTEAFRGCMQITEIVIPESVTHIDGQAFYHCENLERAVINSSGIIDSYAFANCFALRDVTINGDITEIGTCAFDNAKFTSITFPATLTKIGNSAFQACTELSEIRFTGSAPEIEVGAFERVTATAYYPGEDPTWTEDKFQDYGGDLTWVNGHVHQLVEGDPVFDPSTRTHKQDCLTCEVGLVQNCSFTSTITQEATLTAPAIHTYTCSVCGGSYEERFPCRIYGDNRYETGFSAADMLKQQLGVDKFGTIIVASGLDFADALTGSYLAAVKSAPILLVNQHFMDEAAAYISENLADGGNVYLLGGELAIAPAMEEMLSGLDVERLAGANRLETNLKILEEAGVGDEEILVCYSHGFADSLSASAVGKPILMVNRGLTDAQKDFLANTSGKFVIIGGESAVSAAIEEQLQAFGTTERIGGANRYETSINVAMRFFETPQSVVLAYGANFPDGLCGGPLAYAAGAPLILTRDQNARLTAAYTAEYGITVGAVLGGPGLISEAAVNTILCQ